MDNKPDNELQTKELQTKNNSKNQIIIAVVLVQLVSFSYFQYLDRK